MIKTTWTAETYTPQIEGFEDENGISDEARGYEISLVETLEIRRGKFDDDDGERHFDTEGFTVKADGLLRLMSIYLNDEGWPSLIARHLSVSWTKFSYDDFFGGVDHAQITLKY